MPVLIDGILKGFDLTIVFAKAMLGSSDFIKVRYVYLN
jgi:hypothetical protein